MELTFWNKNKVFILGLLSAAIITAQPFFEKEGAGGYSWQSIGMAVLIAVSSFVGKEWRGQGLSITGIIGVTAFTFAQMQGDSFNTPQFILAVGMQIIALAAPDPKSRGYEQTDTIKQAKAQGEEIVHAKLTAKPTLEPETKFDNTQNTL